MKQFIMVLIALFLFCRSYAGDMERYFDHCRRGDGVAMTLRQNLLQHYSMSQLVTAVEPYRGDSNSVVRGELYYLLLAKSKVAPAEERKLAANLLVAGLDDSAASNVWQVISYLQQFSPDDFASSAREALGQKLLNVRRPHFSKLLLLAGYLHVGSEWVKAVGANQKLSQTIRWAAMLALARMGDEQALDFCLSRVKAQAVNDRLVDVLLPDLIYTRQHKAVDYCVELLQDDRELCSSPDPNRTEKIQCAYQLIGLLAPVTVNFPLKVDPSVGLESNDYPATLKQVRNWYRKNKNYQIVSNTY